jgi:hypothetical protein
MGVLDATPPPENELDSDADPGVSHAMASSPLLSFRFCVSVYQHVQPCIGFYPASLSVLILFLPLSTFYFPHVPVALPAESQVKPENM